MQTVVRDHISGVATKLLADITDAAQQIISRTEQEVVRYHRGSEHWCHQWGSEDVSVWLLELETSSSARDTDLAPGNTTA